MLHSRRDMSFGVRSFWDLLSLTSHMNLSKHFNISLSHFSHLWNNRYLPYKLFSELKTIYAVCLNQFLPHSKYSKHVNFLLIMAPLLSILENSEDGYSLRSIFASQRYFSNELSDILAYFQLASESVRCNQKIGSSNI